MGRGMKCVAQRVHRNQRGLAGDIAVVIGKRAARDRGACFRFNRYNVDIGAVDLIEREWKRKTGEIAAAARAADHDVGQFFTRHFQLLFGLKTDNGLVQHNVIEHAAERIARLAACVRNGRLNGLADGDSEAAGRVGDLGQNTAADLGLHAGACHALAAPQLHHHLAKRFLVKADAHHEDLAVQTDQAARKRQGRCPTALPRFRSRYS